MTDSLILYSGGMDSTVLLAVTRGKGRKTAAISFDYGSKHNEKELKMAEETCHGLDVAHTVVRLPFIDTLFSSTLLQSGGAVPDGMYDEPNMKATVVPFRNGIMLSIAVGYAETLGAGEVLLASHAGDHFIYPDCRPEFNAAFAKAAWFGTDEKVRVTFPFARMDKRDIGDLGRKLGVDFRRTWTCYKGETVHCGTCGACQERKYALRYDQGLDDTIYAK